MKLPWQKNREAPRNAVKMRAAVTPKTYKFQVTYGSTYNNFTVSSYSTHLVTLQLLKPGETAESVSKFAPGTVNFGGGMFTREEEAQRNLQRLQFDAPNWVGVIVCSDGAVYYDHVELPVWADPTTGKIFSVDVDQMLVEMEPKRQKASEIWGEEEGPFALYFQIKNLPRDIAQTGKFLASLPGEWMGAIKDMKDDMAGNGKPSDPLPSHMKPDLSQYPPIDGMDYKAWTLCSANPENLQALGFTQEAWVSACKGWNQRMMKDWKLGAQHGSDLDRIRKGATASWEDQS
jgi:hypothetical protein